VNPRLASVNGVGIAHYVRGAGPPALFIMGLGGRATDWNERFLGAVARRFEVITFDNRGTGASDRPPGEYTLELMADEAVGVLDALSRPRALLRGTTPVPRLTVSSRRRKTAVCETVRSGGQVDERSVSP